MVDRRTDTINIKDPTMSLYRWGDCSALQPNCPFTLCRAVVHADPVMMVVVLVAMMRRMKMFTLISLLSASLFIYFSFTWCFFFCGWAVVGPSVSPLSHRQETRKARLGIAEVLMRSELSENPCGRWGFARSEF